ncbi:hypothetical protein E4U23_000659 [Claviceps purpurea]|nr:hypothetical protein E4U23_000659 [Claviceps purpurea]
MCCGVSHVVNGNGKRPALSYKAPNEFPVPRGPSIGQVDGATPQPGVARRYQPIAPRTAAADYDHHGAPVFHRRGERPNVPPAMQQARRDQVAISRAHRVQARDDLQPSPSQTPPLPDIMRGRQELDALHRRHEEERLAGASPSSTPAMREHLGRQRGRALSPSPSSPFSPRSSSLRSPSVASQTISMVESLGSDYQPSSSFGVARI